MDNKIGFRTKTEVGTVIKKETTTMPNIDTEQELLFRIGLQKAQDCLLRYLAGEVWDGVLLQELAEIKRHFLTK